jgi:hypothetical protein
MGAQYVPTHDCNFNAPKGVFHLKWNKMDVCTALQRLSLGHPKCASDLQQEFSPCVLSEIPSENIFSSTMCVNLGIHPSLATGESEMTRWNTIVIGEKRIGRQ